MADGAWGLALAAGAPSNTLLTGPDRGEQWQGRLRVERGHQRRRPIPLVTQLGGQGLVSSIGTTTCSGQTSLLHCSSWGPGGGRTGAYDV